MAKCSTCQGTAKSVRGAGRSVGDGGPTRWHPNVNRGGAGCSSCQSDCAGGCSRSSSGMADNNASGDNCWCGHNCAGCGGCRGQCSGCSGDCSGCSGSCGGSCSGTCSSGCSHTCTGSCTGYCKGTCKGSCQGGCDTACTNGCGHLCNATCRSDVAIEAYEYLKNYKNNPDIDPTFAEHLIEDRKIFDWLDAKDIKYLFDILQEEGRRRVVKKTPKFSGDETHKATEEQPLTNAEKKTIGLIDENNKTIGVKSGEFADDKTHIKKLNELLINNVGTQVSTSVGGGDVAEGKKIKKSVGVDLVEKAIKAYNEKIPISSTSDKAGQQTK